jgi:hydrogenase nickel incorporation protein HypA/HybF
MHELGIVTEIVSVASDRARALGTERVTRLVLEIGKLSTVLPDAVRFCFDVAAEGTPLGGAALEIREVAGKGRCRACSSIVVMERPVARCTCGEFDLEWLSGTQVQIVEMEVV